MVDSAIHEMMRGLRDVRWRETSVPGVEYYYGEEGVYIYRCNAGTDKMHYVVAQGRSPEDALGRMGLPVAGRTLSDGRNVDVSVAEQRLHFARVEAEYSRLLNMVAARKALKEIHAWCHNQDNPDCLVRENCEDLAVAALSAPARNCERFASWEEAKAAYWKEVGDPCDWRKLGAWLFAKVEKEGGAR